MSVPRSFLKNVNIPLDPEYTFVNTPFDKEQPGVFIGRKLLRKKFHKFLKDSGKGVYLVTGYRGMGKTSFVNKVLRRFISEHENDQKKNRRKFGFRLKKESVIDIKLTIAQNNPTEISVLKQIVSSMLDNHKNNKRFRKYSFDAFCKIAERGLRSLLFLSVMVFIGLLAGCFFSAVWNKPLPGVTKFISDHKDLLVKPFLLIPIISAALFGLLLIICRFINNAGARRKSDNEFYKKIRELADRTFSAVSEEDSPGRGFNIDFKGVKASTEDSRPKKAKLYPLATAKEIEYELTSILEYVKANRQYIFVFDELDKVDLFPGGNNIYRDIDGFEETRSANTQDIMRNRKQAVLGVISGLKNFFTTADARFIFIAGREMFDASLADVSDKQSPLSSIFTYTFNIESLLKEQSVRENEINTSSLTNAVEEFLKLQICSKAEIDSLDNPSAPRNYTNAENEKFTFSELSFFDYLFHRFYPHKNEQDKDQVRAYGKIALTFQNFITYLAYRSNGSPKKLIKAFHEFVEIKEEAGNEEKDLRTRVDGDFKKSKFFLCFNYYNQYRIGFINYFYRPFLIQHGSTFKFYSDNAVMAIPYLFDHLIKFHRFAFSRSNLEMVPELLSTNKTPSIKQDLDNIIAHLGATHIRDTDIELFEFKFYSKSYNEIVFLSRIFEEEAAAFNFTLDENYPVKLLLHDKIKELRSIFSRMYKDGPGGDKQIFSIAYHNSNLGDLHFFDQQFDDAIGNYSDAIRPINNIEVSKMNIRDFVTLIKNKLKIGLCFEKINSYEEALTFYSDSAQDVKRFMSYHLNRGKYLKFPEKKSALKKTENGNDVNFRDEENETEVFYSSSLNDILQIAVQCFLAKIYLQEKMGLEGITSTKAKAITGEFLKIIKRVSTVCGRNYILISNAFFQIGKLHFFKNSPFYFKIDDETEPAEEDGRSYYPAWVVNRIDVFYKKIQGQLAEENRRQPVCAYVMYLLALDELLEGRFIKDISAARKNDAPLAETGSLNEYFVKLDCYIENSIETYPGVYYKYIGSILSSLGDCILSMHGLQLANGKPCRAAMFNRIYDEKTKKNSPGRCGISYTNIFDPEKISEWTTASITEKPAFIDIVRKYDHKNWCLTDVIRCYYYAAVYFEKYGRLASASFQWRKILHLLKMILPDIKETLSPNEKAKMKLFLDFLRETVVEKALDLTCRNANRTDKHMLVKAERYKVPLENITNNMTSHPDTREINLYYEYIRLKCDNMPVDIDNLVNSHNSIATQHSRMMELDYYSKYLSHRKIKSNEISHWTEYFFSMHSILRILKVYGSDYMLGFSYTAYVHFHIAGNCENNFVKANIIAIEKQTKGLFNGESMVMMDAEYHYSMAMDNYAKSIQLHTAGSEYKKTVKDMIYLEDDFNDNAYHFGAAADRYMMTNGIFDYQIEECKKALQAIKKLNT